MGLALTQDKLQGELRWHELLGLTAKTGSFTLAQSDTVGPRLQLKVAGATITILDIYHWPLEHIRHVIGEYAGK